MKLDCGNAENFLRFNQPINNVDYDAILQGLSEMDDLTIQALIADGSGGNSHEENISPWLEKIAALSPSEVQIYTLDRPFPSRGAGRYF